MTNELKIIIAIGLLIIAVINVTRAVWKSTETYDIKAFQEIACLQGGGTPIYNGFNEYLQCTNTK